MWQTFTGDNSFFIEHYAQSHHDIIIEALKLPDMSRCDVIHFALKYGATRRIPCQPRTVGNILRIREHPTERAYLILCEVEVYGTQGKTAIQLKYPVVYL